MAERNATLFLENGHRFRGRALGNTSRCASGPLVFSACVPGYQELLTNPALAGLILVATSPLVGSAGIALDNMESLRVQAAGLVIREKSDYPNNFRMELNLDDLLRENGCFGIEGIDTRALTKLLCVEGTLLGLLTTEELSFEEALSRMKRAALTPVAPPPTEWTADGRVALLDLGATRTFRRELTRRGCAPAVFSGDASASDILNGTPDLLLVSGGPGVVADYPGVERLLSALPPELPVAGTGLGALLLAKAAGADVAPAKCGAFGAVSVRRLFDNRLYPATETRREELSALPADLFPTYQYVATGKTAGFQHRERPLSGVLFSPECAHGPADLKFVMDELLSLSKGDWICR